MTGDRRDAVSVRPYDPNRDAGALWELKQAFETDMGGTGGSDKRKAYDAKLAPNYRDGWLEWVSRCVSENPWTVTLAVDEDTINSRDLEEGLPDAETIGYVFVLPESLTFIWDAAVLNEIYVRPTYRGTGVADLLMETAVDIAQDQSLPMDRLVLDVDRDNEPAREFYMRHDFSHWGEMMVKEL